MRSPALPPKDAFLHLIYDYHHLVLAGSAWNNVGPASSPSSRKQANILIPQVSSLIQDSLLLHARSLIDFYTKSNTRDTDIISADFNLPALSTVSEAALVSYKYPIEVHLLHLTAWRDTNYRAAHSTTPTGWERNRLDWNTENTKIVDCLLKALDEISISGRPWSMPLQDLYRAASATFTKPSTIWPKNLTEKADVTKYLQGLRLA